MSARYESPTITVYENTDLGSTLTTGQAYYSGHGQWFRRDRYRNKNGETSLERYFAAGAFDQSPPLRFWGDTSSYNSECSCCWLGFGHTVDRHNANLG